MGKEWFYWGGGGAAAKSSSSSSSTTSKKGKRSRKETETTIRRHNSNNNNEDDGGATTPGCMCAVFQLFDLPHFHVVLNHNHRSLNPLSSFVQNDHFEPTTGVEAPRNSLDMEEPTVGLKPSLKQEEEGAKNLNNVSVGINQIRTSCDSRPSSSCKPRSEDYFSSECSSSPGGSKTPNLVARLMGLDLLPENDSPTFTYSPRASNLQPKSEPRDRARYLLHHQQDRGRPSSRSSFDGTISLPETPRISLARKSDVDHHHRLSLQILNKENNVAGQEFDDLSLAKRVARRCSNKKRSENVLRNVDENIVRSPSYYARQIVKQVKESVSRKVGVDITNNIKDKDNNNNQVVLLKPNKPSILYHDFSPKNHQSSSPRFKFLDPNTAKLENNPQVIPKPKLPQEKSQSVRTFTGKDKGHQFSLNQKNLELQRKIATERIPLQSSKKGCSRSKKEEGFVRPNHENKKGKRATPLSSELLNYPNNVPTILPALKKDHPKLPQKQAHVNNAALSSKKSSQQLPSSPRHYYSDNNTPPTTTSNRNGPADFSGEFQYIQRILKRTGVEKDSSVSLAKWYSTSHPLDPSIFHYMELFHTSVKDSKLNLRSNRKLIFQLVDELLVKILKPHLGFEPRAARGRHLTGSELAGIICSEIRSFPLADCRVLEDIDALIETDMEKPGVFEGEKNEEEEKIVLEIESEVVEELLHETAMVVLGGRRPYSGERERHKF